MPSRQIPRDEWKTFSNRFGEQHRGWPVTIEVLHFDGSPKVVARTIPLKEISADLHDEGSISITAGRDWQEHVMHRVDAPSYVGIQEAQLGAGPELRIKSKDGTTTVVQFVAPE